MSSQYCLLNWEEQSRAVPVEAFTLLGSVGKEEKAANVPEEVTCAHNLPQLCSASSFNSNSDNTTQKVLDSLSYQEFCGPDQLLCH